MNNEQLYQEIKNEFYTVFPNGWFGGGVSKSTFGDNENISFDFGLVDRDCLPSRILLNDPVHHKFFIYVEPDGQLESSTLQSVISVNPPADSYLAMGRVKTKYRKTTGDHAKILKSFQRFFGRLKTLVVENESNIYQRNKYADKFFC